MHTRYNYSRLDGRKYVVATSVIGLSAAVVGATALAAAPTIVSASNAHQESKARKSAAHAADVKAQELEQKTVQAEQDAQLEAEESLRKRQAAQTNTTKTSSIGVSSAAETSKPTLLGVS